MDIEVIMENFSMLVSSFIQWFNALTYMDFIYFAILLVLIHVAYKLLKKFTFLIVVVVIIVAVIGYMNGLI